jgi:heterogeneous nuclear rnp K-like protein
MTTLDNGAGDMGDGKDVGSAQNQEGPRLGPDGKPAPQTDEEYAATQVTIRSILTSKDAGVIIGKGGKNIADLRDETGVKAGVTKVIPGVTDRVLTITGSCGAVSKAYSAVAQNLYDALSASPEAPRGELSKEGYPRELEAVGLALLLANLISLAIKLLIPHTQMGIIIGRQGNTIRQIQDSAGVRLVAQKGFLPQSTERQIVMYGSPEGVQQAVLQIGKYLIDEWQRGTNAVLYDPAVRTSVSSTEPISGGRTSTGPRGFLGMGTGSPSHSMSGQPRRSGNGGFGGRSFEAAGGDYSRSEKRYNANGEELLSENISIPAEMVGPIIGRGGSKITDIRNMSGARVSIAKVCKQCSAVSSASH